MENCDFCAVMKIVDRYISEGERQNQTDLMFCFFAHFSMNGEAFDFDNGNVNRWFKGLAPVSPKIVAFYSNDENNLANLSLDIESNVLPILYDCDMVTQELYELVTNDIGISETKKQQICKHYPCE